MTSTTTAPETSHRSCPDCTDGLGSSVPVPHGSLRDTWRANGATGQVWRVGVLAAGLVFVAMGVALAVLPGPLTIPPVLLGLWIWSIEFAWAKRLFTSFERRPRTRGTTPASTR